MLDRDLRPSRFDLTLEYSRQFITEWFDQNPLGQMGIVGMRAGLGERIGDMSGQCRIYRAFESRCLIHSDIGNPQDVIKALSDRRKLQPDGEPSLQNAIDMARGSMRYAS